MSASDRDLLDGMRRGNEDAARTLWSRHAPRMIAYARAVLAGRDPASARDVVQSVFISVLKASASQVRAVSDPGPWLARMTRNAALNHVRSLRREQARAQRSAGAPQPGRGEAAAGLAEVIEELPRALREVVVLRHVGGLTFDQIAVALDANRSTVASRYRTAIMRLRMRLGAPADPEREVTHAGT